MSALEHQLSFQVRAAKLPKPEQEYRFGAMAAGGIGKGVKQRLRVAGLKDWRFDFAWPDLMLAVEVEGGGWTGGRHTRGKGFQDDMVKYSEAMRLGWNIYRCDANLIKSGQALKVIEALIERSAGEGSGE